MISNSLTLSIFIYEFREIFSGYFFSIDMNELPLEAHHVLVCSSLIQGDAYLLANNKVRDGMILKMVSDSLSLKQ